MPDIQSIEWFLKTAVFHGLGFVAVSFIILIFLWGLFEGVRLALRFLRGLVEWVPQWFSSQVDLHTSLKDGVVTATESLSEIHQAVKETNDGVKELLIIHREREQ